MHNFHSRSVYNKEVVDKQTIQLLLKIKANDKPSFSQIIFIGHNYRPGLIWLENPISFLSLRKGDHGVLSLTRTAAYYTSFENHHTFYIDKPILSHYLWNNILILR